MTALFASHQQQLTKSAKSKTAAGYMGIEGEYQQQDRQSLHASLSGLLPPKVLRLCAGHDNRCHAQRVERWLSFPRILANSVTYR